MFYGYIRVSTEEQNLENQKRAISEKYTIDAWVEEKKSGTLDYKKAQPRRTRRAIAGRRRARNYRVIATRPQPLNDF